jgi:hypothetical protein
MTFSYNHISNGGTVKPELGINYPMFGVGLDYVFNPYDFEEREKNRETVLNPDRDRFDLCSFFQAAKVRFRKMVFCLWSVGWIQQDGWRVSAFYAGAELVSDQLVRKSVIRITLTGSQTCCPIILGLVFWEGMNWCWAGFSFPSTRDLPLFPG